MFIHKLDNRVICTTCNQYVITVIEHEKNLHKDDPEWFFESWDGSEEGMYICTKCGNSDYISDSEIF